METRLTFILTASPYSGQTVATALKLATAALNAGHRSTIFATGDGVYSFVRGQQATGVFDAGAAVDLFLARGGEAQL